MAHDATLFGAIDAIHEGFSSLGRGHDYDWTAPVWGVGTGAAFGMLSFMAPAGKANVTKHDFYQGLKGIFNSPVKGDMSSLITKAKWMGNDLRRVDRHIVNYKDRDVDLRHIESYVSTMTNEQGEAYLRGLLTQIRNTEGKSMLKWALKNDWKSSKENWKRMIGGTIIMNARTIKEWGLDGYEPPLEDVLLNVAIGAFINRHGAPRKPDMYQSEMNQLRRGLSILGVKTKNSYDLVAVNERIKEAHLNPLNNDPKLRELVEEADKLGITTNQYEAREVDLRSGVISAKTTSEDITLFRTFHEYLSSAGNKKYAKPLSSLTEYQAMQMEGKLKQLLGKGASEKTLREYLKTSVDLTIKRLDSDISVTAHDIARLLQIKGLQSIGHETMGSLPKHLKMDPTLENMASDGKLRFLRDSEGEILKGKEAVSELSELLMKAENVFEMTRSDLMRASDATGKDNTVTVKPSEIEALHDIIATREKVINDVAPGAKDTYKFSFLDHQVLSTQLRRIKFNKKLDHISNVLDPKSKEFIEDIYPLLIPDTGLGILYPNLDPKIRGGAEIIENGWNIRIVGTNDSSRSRNAREFVNVMVELLGGKGTYSISKGIPSKEVHISLIEQLRDHMNLRGMPTDISALRLISREINRKQMFEHIADSKLTDYDANIISSLMKLESKLVQYQIIGEGRPVGYSAAKIELISKNQDLNDAVRDYNSHIDKLIERGEIGDTGMNVLSLAKERKHFNENDMSFINEWAQIKSDAIEGNKTGREQLNDLIRLVEGPDRLRDALAIAAKENPDKVYEILSLLESEGIIMRNVKRNAQTKVVESVTLELTADSKSRFHDADVQRRIFQTLEKYGINKENIDQIYDHLEKAQELMIEEKFGAGERKVLSEDSFFKKWFATEEGAENLNYDQAN